MNTRGYYLAMVRYHLHQTFSKWLMFGFLIAQTVFLAFIFRWELGRMETSGVGQMINVPAMFGFILMFAFAGGSAQTGATGRAWIISNGEFLLSRPIPRRPIFLSLLVICGSILLICPTIDLLCTLPHPEMLLSLSPGTQASRDLASYQAAFPSSAILHLPKSHHDTLRIPFGSTYQALWALWLIVLAGLGVEAAVLGFARLIRLSITSRSRILAVILCIPAVIVVGWRHIDPHLPIEQSFFLFAEHPVVVVLLTLALFLIIQAAVLRRIEEIEVS